MVLRVEDFGGSISSLSRSEFCRGELIFLMWAGLEGHLQPTKPICQKLPFAPVSKLSRCFVHVCVHVRVCVVYAVLLKPAVNIWGAWQTDDNLKG